MATITAAHETSTDIEICYEDHDVGLHAPLEHLDARDAALAGHPVGAP